MRPFFCREASARDARSNCLRDMWLQGPRSWRMQPAPAGPSTAAETAAVGDGLGLQSPAMRLRVRISNLVESEWRPFLEANPHWQASVPRIPMTCRMRLCSPSRQCLAAVILCANPRICAGATPKSKRARDFIFRSVYSAAGVGNRCHARVRTPAADGCKAIRCARKRMKCGVFQNNANAVCSAVRFAEAFLPARQASCLATSPGRASK